MYSKEEEKFTGAIFPLKNPQPKNSTDSKKSQRNIDRKYRRLSPPSATVEDKTEGGEEARENLRVEIPSKNMRR